MNEFTAKKIGEVLAFAEVGLETFKKGKKAFERVFGKEKTEEIINVTSKHKHILSEIANNSPQKNIIIKKVKGTSAKLEHMRDYYIGEDWDDSTELLEWSGFFEGAALVHWALVESASKESKINSLFVLSQKSVRFHNDVLHLCAGFLRNVGAKRAKE